MVKLLNQVSTLKYLLIVNEQVLILRRPCVLLIDLVLPFNDSLQLRHLNIVLVPDSGDFTKLRVFEHSVSFPKEIIDQQGKLVARPYSSRTFSILLDQRVDLGRDRLILYVVSVLFAKSRPVGCQK